MDYIVNGNKQIIVEVMAGKRLPVLNKPVINAYSKKLRKLQIKGGQNAKRTEI